MKWWRTDQAGRYLECLVREYVNPSDRIDYDEHGNAVDPEDTTPTGDSWRGITSAIVTGQQAMVPDLFQR